jgi:hypothetical protein
LYSLISKENYENCVLIICIQYFGSINKMNLKIGKFDWLNCPSFQDLPVFFAET